MAVERPDHQDETPAMPPRDQPRFRRRPGGAAGETPVEADQAENAKPEIVVQRQQSGELSGLLEVREATHDGRLRGRRATIWTPSVLRTLARAGARSSAVSSCASEKPSGASTRTTVDGISSGRQIVGLSFAGKSGSRAKGYPPATGKLRHGGLFGDLARGDSLQGLSEVLAVVGIAPQELPGKARAIEPQQRVDRMLRPPVRRPWHA